MNLTRFYTNKVVLITGGSQGIGKELAKQVLAHQGKVVITARNAEMLALVKKEFAPYENSLMIHAGDVTNYQDNIELVNKIITRFGRLDVLITNAGISAYGEIESMKPEVATQVINTNIYGTLFPIMAAIPELKKSQGSILLVSSVAGFSGIPGNSAYSLSKMSLIALAESLRIELDRYQIFVGIAFPGFTKNDPNKKTMNPMGDLEKVSERPNNLTLSREKMASNFLAQIMNKKYYKVFTIFGWLAHFTSKYFPAIFHYILKKNYIPT